MLKNSTINIKTIEKIAKVLGELNEHVLYVGGAIVSFTLPTKAQNNLGQQKTSIFLSKLALIRKWKN